MFAFYATEVLPDLPLCLNYSSPATDRVSNKQQFLSSHNFVGGVGFRRSVAGIMSLFETTPLLSSITSFPFHKKIFI